MATSDEIKQRALELSEKTDSNSITPKEVGGIMHDLASLGENAIRNGGTLGIRKVYESVAAMEADNISPVDLWGNPIKKGNLVVIYDGTTTGTDNNKVYAFMNPGWKLATYLDAGYATRSEVRTLLDEVARKADAEETNEKLSELGSKLIISGLDFASNVVYNSYYDTEGIIRNDTTGMYRRLPLLPCSGTIAIHNLDGKYGMIRLYDAEKNYLVGQDQKISVRDLPLNAAFVGVYWQKNEDDYSETIIELGQSKPFTYIIDLLKSNKRDIELVITEVSEQVTELNNTTTELKGTTTSLNGNIETLELFDVDVSVNLGKFEDVVIYDAYYNVDGSLVQSQTPINYRCLPLLRADAKKPFNYLINGSYVNVRCFNTSKEYIGDALKSNNTITLLENTAYVGIYWMKTDDDYSNDYIDRGFKIVNSQEIETSVVLSVKNSDKIAIIGDSYTESHYTVKNKAYINKLSLFSDYQFVNWGVSGDIYIGRLNQIRDGGNHYGSIAFKEIAPKYAMMCCFTNDIKYMNLDAYIECLDNICTVLKGLGTEPIICTEYQTGGTSESKRGVKTALMNYAREHNYLFWDIASYCDILRPNSWSSHYAPFWGGSHAGTRTNAIEADPYQMLLKGLEKPNQSIKLFRLRGSYSSLDDLLFRNNDEKAKLFKEINVGHTHITDASLVDNCTSAAQTKQQDEYQIIQEGGSVPFGNMCLLTAVLPYDKNSINSLSVTIPHVGTISKVYVLNRMATPYNEYKKYTRFDYTNLTNTPKVGDVYTASNDGNTKQFTVVKVAEGVGDEGSLGSIFCTPSDGSTNTGGTLTKVSGSGDSSIPFSYRAIGYDTDNITSDTCGHWTEVTGENDNYQITDLNGSVYLDKVELLIVGSNLSIADVKIKVEGTGGKMLDRKQLELVFNKDIETEELLPSNTFASPNTLDSKWNVQTSDIYEHINGIDSYPTGCSSIVKVTDETILNCTISKEKLKEHSSTAILEVWCRYFPDIYSDGSGNQITENSFDYNKLIVKVGDSATYNTEVSELVNTYWKIVRIPIVIDNNSSDLSLSILSNNLGLEIAYVSLKYQ